jgi:hypothetical protein
MPEKNWFKVETTKDREQYRIYVGSSPLSLDEILASLQRSEYLRLEDLLYWDRTEFKLWREWDKAMEPVVAINPAFVVTIMPFVADPRTIPSH